MKYALALLLLASCARQPCPTVFLPRAVETPVASAPSGLLPKGLLESRIRRECEGRYGRSVAMSTFCACLADAVVENARELGIVTYQDFHERVEEAVPTPRQIRACMPVRVDELVH